MKKRKLPIRIAAFLTIIGLIVWITLLYTQKAREEKAWEREFQIWYHGALNDMTSHLDRFQGARSLEEQFSCLQAITDDFMQLKTYMQIHISLASISTPEDAGKADTLGWRNAATAAEAIRHGATINSARIESFQADGIISQQETAVMNFLKEETEKLYHDMTEPEDAANYRYVLPSLEVYQRLAEIMGEVKARLIRLSED